ncbi:MAG: FdhF/YdeP family oxidoreductase, partial [Pseudomonadota bacterium]|nr:FdhF/YdeP family oxidoreductase [Pseudomonadota bacterium]
LLARLYGTNNLPDSSNMCHESTSVALPQSIGVPVGTVRLEDFEATDCILFFGQNVGTSSPRMLHQLRDARQRGIEIITFNPLKERGLERFINPQSPTQMLSGRETIISTQYHQVRAGGDIAAIYGMCKVLIEADDAARRTGAARVLDVEFIQKHTRGFEQFADTARSYSWPLLERQSGLEREALERAAHVYMRANAVIATYGMGLTQHRTGVENCQMVVNLLLLRGNIGRPGAGICPVRGHSNVQGQRTVGISEKPELVPLDRLASQFAFQPPRDRGLNTVEACAGILKGDVHAFIGLGGNFGRAIPETRAMEAAWRKLRLTVQISTKLNRNHVIHGVVSYLLPCLSRTEVDQQASGEQVITVEDSTGCIHASRGAQAPASSHLLSEPSIVAQLARAIGVRGSVDWDAWTGDYSLVRDAIERTWPDEFHDFNARKLLAGGFPRPNAARERQWKTKTGKANFIVPRGLVEDLQNEVTNSDVLTLMTLRSNDQFNTTIYGYDDRFRGVQGTREILFMNAADIDRLGLANDERVTVTAVVHDGVSRAVPGLRVVAYDIPKGCCGGYYPECNPLIPLWHHAEGSQVPAAKSIPVRVTSDRGSRV